MEDESIFLQCCTVDCLGSGDLAGNRSAELVVEGDGPLLTVSGDAFNLQVVVFLNNHYNDFVFSGIVNNIRIGARDFLDEVLIGTNLRQRNGSEDEFAVYFRRLGLLDGSHVGLGIDRTVVGAFLDIQFKLVSAIGCRNQVALGIPQVLDTL